MDAMDLTEQETMVLCGVLETYLADLHTEISHTDDRGFKEALKTRQHLVEGILHKLVSRAEMPA